MPQTWPTRIRCKDSIFYFLWKQLVFFIFLDISKFHHDKRYLTPNFDTFENKEENFPTYLPITLVQHPWVQFGQTNFLLSGPRYRFFALYYINIDMICWHVFFFLLFFLLYNIFFTCIENRVKTNILSWFIFGTIQGRYCFCMIKGPVVIYYCS